MTGKRKARGTVSRLEVLEETADQRRAAVEAAKEATWGRVFDRMSSADRQAIDAYCECQEEAGPEWAKVWRLLELATGPIPPTAVSEAALDWQSRLLNTPEGQLWPLPADPDAFTAHFKAAAADSEAVGARVGLAPEALTGARWSAAWCRMMAILLSEAGAA